MFFCLLFPLSHHSQHKGYLSLLLDCVFWPNLQLLKMPATFFPTLEMKEGPEAWVSNVSLADNMNISMTAPQGRASGPRNHGSYNHYTRAHSTQNQILDRLNVSVFKKKKKPRKGERKNPTYYFVTKKPFLSLTWIQNHKRLKKIADLTKTYSWEKT